LLRMMEHSRSYLH